MGKTRTNHGTIAGKCEMPERENFLKAEIIQIIKYSQNFDRSTARPKIEKLLSVSSVLSHQSDIRVEAGFVGSAALRAWVCQLVMYSNRDIKMQKDGCASDR